MLSIIAKDTHTHVRAKSSRTAVGRRVRVHGVVVILDEKLQIFLPVFLTTPLSRFAWTFVTPCGLRKLERWGYQAEKQITSPVVSIQYTYVTDRKTDRHRPTSTTALCVRGRSSRKFLGGGAGSWRVLTAEGQKYNCAIMSVQGHRCLLIELKPVMWSQIVSLKTRPVWDQKIGLGLVRCGLGLAYCGLGLGLTGLVLFCEKRSCHACRHNDLEGHRYFSSTICSLSILCLKHHYCGDQQWRSLP